jgi:hypothetical protein
MATILRFNPANLLGLPSFGAMLKPAAAKGRREPRFDNAHSPGTYPAPRPAAGDDNADLKRLLAAVKTAPELPLIEWDGDRARPCEPQPSSSEASADESDPRHLEPRRRRIRDRYISARFPGVARSGSDLAVVSRVVKAARLYFEEDEGEMALELLQLAIEEAPHESALRLARLELLFLARDREGFVHAAREFNAAHPFHDAWTEVARLGRAIAPDEPLFGAVSGPRDHDHYGPWPHLPNWIQAPWDLTGEIVAADFHRAMSRALPRAASTQTA